MVFLDRSRRGQDYPWLQWKVRLFAIGAGLALGAVILEWDWLIIVAIVVLIGAFSLRFLPGGRGIPDASVEEDEDRSQEGWDEGQEDRST